MESLLKSFVLGSILLMASALLACNGDSTSTPAPTASATSTVTASATATPTGTSSATVTATVTAAPTLTATESPTATPTASETASPEPSETPTETATETPTPRPTGTIPGPIDTPEPDPEADAYAHALVGAMTENLGTGWSINDTDDFSGSLTEGFEYDTDACNEMTNTLGQADDLTMLAGIGKAAVSYQAPVEPGIDPALDVRQPDVNIEIQVLNDESAAHDAAALIGEVLLSDRLLECFGDVFRTETPEAKVTIERRDPEVAAPENGYAGAYAVTLVDGEDTLNFVSNVYILQVGSTWLTVELSAEIHAPATAKAAMDALTAALATTPAP